MGLAFSDGLVRIVPVERPPGLRLEGEIDRANTPALASALAAAAQAGGDVHVDLAGLTFIDVDGLRVLARTAATFTDGRCLVLRDVPAHLRRIIRLVGWDAIPGLELGGDR